MQRRALQLDTSLAWAKGAYTVAVAIGSEGRRANLVLDSGSSSLAVSASAYDPARDHDMRATPWAQEVDYGGGSWAGPVVGSSLAFGSGRHARRIADALFAVIETDGALFRQADGIFGLAYRELDPAHDVGELLRSRGIAPPLSWPWPFDTASAPAFAAFRADLRQQPRLELTPAFSALEEEGVVRDLFAMQVQRAVVHVLDDAASGHQLAADPLNRGVLVLGGGEEAEALHHGGFQSIRIVHDLYYNANLIAVQVGDGPRIPVPPLEARHFANHGSNALLDTGSSFLVLENTAYRAVLDAFAVHDPQLPALVARFGEAFRSGGGLPNHAIDPRAWPDLHLVLEAPDGGEARLRVPASHYWPHNALKAGQSLFLLAPQLPHWPNQSILGLPLFCGRYAIFDRQASGQGQVRMAPARGP